MKIIIVGAGRIGSNLAKSLSDENHEIYLIESDEVLAARLDEKLDVKVIRGKGADPDILKLSKIEEADLVVAVTASDETNIVVCSISHYLGAKKCISRVRSASFIREFGVEQQFKRFFIDELINPEEVAGQAIVKTVNSPGALEVGDFAGGKILLRAFVIPEKSPLSELALEELNDENFPWPFLIIAISRNKKVIFPKRDTRLLAGDRIYALLPAPSLAEFLTFVNPQSKKANKVIIYGATITGEYVAKTLSGKGVDIIVLEENTKKAEDVAGRLEQVRIINGSGAERDVLIESGIEAADVFVACCDNDHSNLISAVLAKKMGAKKTIITTQQPDYMTIVDALAIDVIVNPHLLAVEQILRSVRGVCISSVTKLSECHAEAVEFLTEKNSPITKAPLSKIKFPKNAIVGAVCTKDQVILAKGDTHIREGQKVIVFCHGNLDKNIQAMFTSKKFF